MRPAHQLSSRNCNRYHEPARRFNTVGARLSRSNLSGERIIQRVGQPKTKAGLREIDLAGEMAKRFREYIGDRKDGFLFPSRKGRAWASQSSLSKRILAPALKSARIKDGGWHSFRRFRITFLRKCQTLESLVKF